MLFNAKGRLNRKPFICRIACVWIISGVLHCLAILINDAAKNFAGIPPEYLSYLIPEMWPLILAILVVTLVILLATVFIIWWEVVLYIRRLHDLNLSGWWFAVTIPCYFTLLIDNLAFSVILWTFNLGTLFVLCALKGTRGPNRFDEDPLPDHTSYFA